LAFELQTIGHLRRERPYRCAFHVAVSLESRPAVTIFASQHKSHVSNRHSSSTRLSLALCLLVCTSIIPLLLHCSAMAFPSQSSTTSVVDWQLSFQYRGCTGDTGFRRIFECRGLDVRGTNTVRANHRQTSGLCGGIAVAIAAINIACALPSVATSDLINSHILAVNMKRVCERMYQRKSRLANLLVPRCCHQRRNDRYRNLLMAASLRQVANVPNGLCTNCSSSVVRNHREQQCKLPSIYRATLHRQP
jgi:hypothetical protein